MKGDQVGQVGHGISTTLTKYQIEDLISALCHWLLQDDLAEGLWEMLTNLYEDCKVSYMCCHIRPDKCTVSLPDQLASNVVPLNEKSRHLVSFAGTWLLHQEVLWKLHTKLSFGLN